MSNSTHVLRWVTLVWGTAILVWLSLEDSSPVPVAILATGASLLLLGTQVLHRVTLDAVNERYIFPISAAFGALSGASTAITTAILMLLKTGMHAHGVPDYSFVQMMGMVERAPLWALAGALLAIGIALAVQSVKLQAGASDTSR
ncbi:MAG: hypothetical protein KC519_16570 [Anaerolineae bacterium]|nr:hypothetical protein [Anaerolineae bacterium]